MPDDPPVSTTVSETVTVDTGADKASADSVNDAFEDFWRDTDADAAKQPTDAPAAPGEGAAQETKKAAFVEPSLEPKVESRPAPKKELTDDEIDKMETPPEWRPEVIEQVKNIKDLWKADRAKAREEAERAAKLESDLEEVRKNAWTPETKADYEHAAAIRRKFDVASDPEFIQKFHQPVYNQFKSVLEQAVQVLPYPQAAQEWAEKIAKNYPPDQLQKQWWEHSVIANVPDELDRESLRSSVVKLIELQRARDTELSRCSNDESAFDNWTKERDRTRGELMRQNIMAEIGVQEKRFEGLLHRDVNTAKTPEERQAIEKHNEYFDKVNTRFQEVILDLDKNDKDIKNRGRAWVRAAVQAGMAFHLDNQNKLLESELKSTKTERDQLKAELDKITGVRRKISSTTGTPPTPAGKKQTGDGLSIKDLDVRKSFEQFDWGDRT